MKKMKQLLLFILLSPLIGMSQDNIVTNLQLRARTIKLLAASALKSEDTSLVKTFFAWNVQFKTNNPNDNANVTIDSALTTDVARMYELLLLLPAALTEVEDFLGDFKTSIQSKRNTNAYLDLLCDGLESYYTGQLNRLKAEGEAYLKLQ